MERKTLKRFILDGIEKPLVFDGENFFAEEVENAQKVKDLLEEFDELHIQTQHGRELQRVKSNG